VNEMKREIKIEINSDFLLDFGNSYHSKIKENGAYHTFSFGAKTMVLE